MTTIIGGRPFNFTYDEVLNAMRGQQQEVIREHLVEMLDTVFPPKQVLATVTGWDRSTFTTMEAQRALTKLGFVCRRGAPGVPAGGAWADVRAQEEPIASSSSSPGRDEASDASRLAAAEAGLATAMEAIASLRGRVQALEASFNVS